CGSFQPRSIPAAAAERQRHPSPRRAASPRPQDTPSRASSARRPPKGLVVVVAARPVVVAAWDTAAASVACSFPRPPPGGTAQRVINARLPAWAGSTEVLDYIGINAQLECLLGIGRRRAAAADQLVAVIEVGARELFLLPFRRIVGINPCGRGDARSTVLVA